MTRDINIDLYIEASNSAAIGDVPHRLTSSAGGLGPIAIDNDLEAGEDLTYDGAAIDSTFNREGFSSSAVRFTT